MLTAERLEIGLGAETQQTTGIAEERVTPQTWRQDPRLVESYREFEFFFRKSEQGDKSFTPVRLPSFYVSLAVRLAEHWGQEDRHQYEIGLDTQGRMDFAYSLYRNGREQHVATIFPHAHRNDQVAMVYSVEQASDFFQLLHEAKLREEEGWKKVAPEDAYALEPQRHGIK